MKKIEKLTEYQESLLPIYRDKWIDYGLSTKPADRDIAEEGVKHAYAVVGLKEPKIVWCTSPMAGAITYTILDKLSNRDIKINTASVGASVGDSVYKAGWGQYDANWIGFYDYFEHECGLSKECEKMLGLRMITQSSGWWWPMKELCILTERPVSLCKNDRGGLHCENRAALEYPDGWGVYSWNGTRVEKYIILQPEEITAEKIENENNSEIRRVMLERYGFQRYFRESGGRLIDTKEVWGQPVKLFKKTLKDVDMHYIHVINGTIEPDGTRHEFIINVKNINNNARDSVFGTYPELCDRLKSMPNAMDLLVNSIRS